MSNLQDGTPEEREAWRQQGLQLIAQVGTYASQIA